MRRAVVRSKEISNRTKNKLKEIGIDLSDSMIDTVSETVQHAISELMLEEKIVCTEFGRLYIKKRNVNKSMVEDGYVYKIVVEISPELKNKAISANLYNDDKDKES